MIPQDGQSLIDLRAHVGKEWSMAELKLSEPSRSPEPASKLNVAIDLSSARGATDLSQKEN